MHPKVDSPHTTAIKHAVLNILKLKMCPEHTLTGGSELRLPQSWVLLNVLSVGGFDHKQVFGRLFFQIEENVFIPIKLLGEDCIELIVLNTQYSNLNCNFQSTSSRTDFNFEIH